MLISQTDTAGTLYFLPDAQGSTRALADSNGALGQTYDYDAFGNLQGDYQSGLDTNYLYTGQQFDVISELYSLRARYYDTSIGRFLSRDTWAYDFGNPIELNRYVYTANNPATMVDPTGYMAMTSTSGRAKMTALVIPVIKAFGKGFLAYVTLRLIEPLLNINLDILHRENQQEQEEEGIGEGDGTSAIPELFDPDRARMQRDLPPIPEENSDLKEHPIGEPKGPFVPPITRTRRKGSGNCSAYEDELGTQDINLFVGGAAHLQIQTYFEVRFGASAEVEYRIPGSGVGGGVGRADAVLLDEGIRWGSLPDNNYAGIYEIKPSSQSENPAAAQAQRDRYINNFHLSRQGGTAVAGTAWRPKNVVVGPWLLDPSQELVISSYYEKPNYEGLVFYWCRSLTDAG